MGADTKRMKENSGTERKKNKKRRKIERERTDY